MKIFDVHTHPTFEAGRTDYDGVNEVVTYASTLGVEGMVVLGDVLLYGRTPSVKDVQAINSKTAELAEWFPDYLHGFCFLNPLLGESFVVDETERCISQLGFKGIKLEICNNARDDVMGPVMEQARKLNVPVLQHTADQTIIQEREFHTDPADTAWLGRQHPDVDIIMAHLTACGKRGVMEIADVPNVRLDTSAFQPVSGLVEFAVMHLGADRVIYGSDLLIRDLPTQIGRVKHARIDDADKQKIFFDNAVSLLFDR
ncbi:MAG: amidohydrolase family protein [Rhodothermales bacterium]|nr:amidohydrolase family protein [Rhodothermales bacterium]